MKVLQLVRGCHECPNKVYYSGGRSECTAAHVVLPPIDTLQGYPAEWCPLPEYPATAMERMRDEIRELKTTLAAATLNGGER